MSFTKTCQYILHKLYCWQSSIKVLLNAHVDTEHLYLINRISVP